MCLHVTLLLKPLREDWFFSNCIKRLKRKKLKNIRWSVRLFLKFQIMKETRTSNILPVSLFRPICSHNKRNYFVFIEYSGCILCKHTRNTIKMSILEVSVQSLERVYVIHPSICYTCFIHTLVTGVSWSLFQLLKSVRGYILKKVATLS